MLYIESIWLILVRDYAEIPFGDFIIGLLHSPYQRMVLGDQNFKKTRWIETIWFALVGDYAGTPYDDVIIELLHSP